MIVVGEGYVAARDMGSSNGTYVNDEKVDDEKELKNGDRLKVGPLEFEVQLAVQVGKKKRPKVRNVQEAAERTVEAAGDDAFDVAAWLEDEDEDEDDADAPTVMTIDRIRQQQAEEAKKAEAEEKDKDDKEEEEAAGQSGSKKPATDSSRSAAAEMLKQFFDGH